MRIRNNDVRNKLKLPVPYCWLFVWMHQLCILFCKKLWQTHLLILFTNTSVPEVCMLRRQCFVADPDQISYFDPDPTLKQCHWQVLDTPYTVGLKLEFNAFYFYFLKKLSMYVISNKLDHFEGKMLNNYGDFYFMFKGWIWHNEADSTGSESEILGTA
jgi:hypothetical protein